MPAKVSTPTKAGEFNRNDPTIGPYIDFPDTDSSFPSQLNKQSYLGFLAAGKAVGIHRVKEYPTFYKLFQRHSEKHQLGMTLSMRQVRENFWLLIARQKSAPKAGNMLDGDFRNRGRFVWYASQLERGEVLKLESNTVARLAQRAWMLSTPKERRGDRECLILTEGKLHRVYVQNG